MNDIEHERKLREVLKVCRKSAQARENDGEEQDPDCTCRLEHIRPNMISPPEIVRNPWCPVHGRDPDYERERQIDREIDRSNEK